MWADKSRNWGNESMQWNDTHSNPMLNTKSIWIQRQNKGMVVLAQGFNQNSLEITTNIPHMVPAVDVMGGVVFSLPKCSTGTSSQQWKAGGNHESMQPLWNAMWLIQDIHMCAKGPILSRCIVYHVQFNLWNALIITVSLKDERKDWETGLLRHDSTDAGNVDGLWKCNNFADSYVLNTAGADVYFRTNKLQIILREEHK